MFTVGEIPMFVYIATAKPGFSSNPLEIPEGCCVLRATCLVFERGRFPVLWGVLIRGLLQREYVYKMLSAVSLSVPPDPVTSQSTKDTVSSVSSSRLHAESDPGSVTRSTAQHGAACPTKFAALLISASTVFRFCYLLKWLCFVL